MINYGIAQSLLKNLLDPANSIVYEFNSGTSINIGIGLTTPTAKLQVKHLFNPVETSETIFKVDAYDYMYEMPSLIGSFETCVKKNGHFYGIYQNVQLNPSLWSNYLQSKLIVDDSIALKDNITFLYNNALHGAGITWETVDTDGPFTFTNHDVHTDTYSYPLTLDPLRGVIVNGLLMTDQLRLLDGAGANKVLVSDPEGYGIWTDASSVHDDDWLSSYPHGDVPPKNLYRGPNYLNVGIGTDNPLNMLHVMGGNILISRDPGKAPGSLNGSIFFGEVVSNEYPNGEWGIEYYVDGLNFWKVTSATNPGANHCLFLKNDGNVGIGTENPVSKFQINRNFEKFSAGSLYTFTPISGTSYLGFNAARAERDLWTLDPNPDLSKNGGSVIFSDMDGNTHFSCVPSLIEESGSTPQILSDQQVMENVKMTIKGAGGVDIKGNLSVAGSNISVTGSGYTMSTVHSTIASLAILWTSNSEVSMGFGVDGNGCGHIYRNQIVNPLMSFYETKVGIGDVDLTMYENSPHTLFVEEGITTEEVTVKLKEEWSDYVLKPEYSLIPLEKLNMYIKEHQHLPEIPTSEEVQKNGVELGQMNALLLKKIEELTLYVIELKSELNALKSAVNKEP